MPQKKYYQMDQNEVLENLVTTEKVCLVVKLEDG